MHVVRLRITVDASGTQGCPWSIIDHPKIGVIVLRRHRYAYPLHGFGHCVHHLPSQYPVLPLRTRSEHPACFPPEWNEQDGFFTLAMMVKENGRHLQVPYSLARSLATILTYLRYVIISGTTTVWKFSQYLLSNGVNPKRPVQTSVRAQAFPQIYRHDRLYNRSTDRLLDVVYS